jgi:hypothetical protein
VSLDLASNNINYEGALILFESLRNNESVVSLSLASTAKDGKFRNRIQAKGALYLKDLLMHNQFIQILNISGNSLKNEGVKHVVDGYINEKQTSLDRSKQLISLDLSANEFTA